jgi:PAS domain S-box-containing protein
MDYHNQGKILIVDDDDGTAMLHRNCLERRGFVAISVSTADEAMRIVCDDEVQLIVLDYRLSDGTTGLDFCEALKATGRSVPVVIVTGFSQETTAVNALRAGVRDYVTKSPDYLDYLPEAVVRVLRQVQVERQLSDSESRFAAFMDNGPSVAFITDGDGKYVYVNRRFTEVFKRTLADVEGKTADEIFPAPLAGQMRANDRAAAASSTVVRQTEMIPTADGAERFWTTFRFSFESSSGDALIGGIAIDITDHRRAEEALRLREEQLHKTKKMEAVGTLAGGIAHEFNNFLQAIHGHATFAIQGLAADEPRFHDLEQLLKTVRHASTLTQQILGVGRRQVLRFVEVDLNCVVQDLANIIRPLIGPRLSFEVALDQGMAIVLGDPDELRRMLMNLCINARDAMPSGGALHVATRRQTIEAATQPTHLELKPGHYAVVTVSDTGSGMTDQIKEHVFEPFFTTKESGNGTGLGLAMVYGVVQQHGGAIDLKTAPGRGTTFEVYLPSPVRVEISESRFDPMAEILEHAS